MKKKKETKDSKQDVMNVSNALELPKIRILRSQIIGDLKIIESEIEVTAETSEKCWLQYAHLKGRVRPPTG